LGVQHNGRSGGAQASPEFFCASPLQASLLRAQPSPTSLGSGRLVEPPAASAALVLSVVAIVAVISAAVIVAPSTIVARVRSAATFIGSTSPVSRRALGPAPEIPPLTRRSRAIFRDIEPQGASAYFAPVELLDSLRRVLLGREPNEGKAPRTARLAVLWNVDVNDLTNLSEQLAKLLVRRAEAEVSYEYLA
jgi:hypothetical protein